MIVSYEQLSKVPRQVTMVDGGFDPIHAGHIAYFREAAGLGLPVLCNVSADTWVVQKHLPLLPQAERVEILDAVRWIDWTHASSGPTARVLEALRPRYYAKGSDWRGRLPVEETTLCDRLGIEVVFLDTVAYSSTDILRRYRQGEIDGR